MTQRVKILIVQNDCTVALNLQNLLKDAGYQVLGIASTGEEALKAVSLQEPNLLLIDMMLPGRLDGIQVAEEIYTHLAIPVVYLATINQAKTPQVKVTEPYGYLIKPFQPRQLYSAIEITLYRHKISRQIQEKKQQIETSISSIGDIEITTDEEGWITSMNPVAESLMGWSVEENEGRKLSQVFKLIDSRIREEMVRQQAIYFELFQNELLLRQEIETQLQASEEFLQKLYQNSSTAIFVIDVLPDDNFYFLGMNPASQKLTGISLEEILGKSPEQLFPHNVADAISANYIRCIQEGTTIYYEECLPFQGRDSWWFTTLTPLYDEQSKIYRLIGNALDITERKHAEQRLHASLKEKEVLLREIHHRVKNNLQVVLSLLDLQAQQSKDRHVLDMFQESKNRIRAMALIHEELYQSDNLAKINFADYVDTLLFYLFQIYGIEPENINLQIKIESIVFSIETAIPCALIISELVSNSLKHAFFPEKKGTIWVELNSVQQTPLLSSRNQFLLVVGDDGVNCQESHNLASNESFGLHLVRTLVKQLEGSIDIEPNQGTIFKIIFPV